MTSKQSSLYKRIRNNTEKLAQLFVEINFWYERYLKQLDASYRKQIAEFETSFKQDIESIEKKLQQSKTNFDENLAQINSQHQTQIDEIENQFHNTTENILEKLSKFTTDNVLPDWDDKYWASWSPSDSINEIPQLSIGSATYQIKQNDFSFPLFTSFLKDKSIFIQSTPDQLSVVHEFLTSLIFKLLAAIPPGDVSLTIIGNINEQLTKSFQTLTEYSTQIVQWTNWENQEKAESLLKTLVSKLEIKNSIMFEDDNENTQFQVLIVLFPPDNISQETQTRLQNIQQNGISANTFSLFCLDSNSELQESFYKDNDYLDNLSVFSLTEEISIWKNSNIENLQLKFDSSPPSNITNSIIDSIGEKLEEKLLAQTSCQIILDRLPPNHWEHNSIEKIEIPIGIKDNFEQQQLIIDDELDHLLCLTSDPDDSKSPDIFPHLIIANTSLLYSPEEVEFYILDFSSRNHFAFYETIQLPHLCFLWKKTDDTIINPVEQLTAEITRRKKLLQTTKKDHYSEYRNATSEKLPRIIIYIIGEKTDYIDDTFENIKKLLPECKSLGIHYIFTLPTTIQAPELLESILPHTPIRIATQYHHTLFSKLFNNDEMVLSHPSQTIISIQYDDDNQYNRFRVYDFNLAEFTSLLEYLHSLSIEKEITRPKIIIQDNIESFPTPDDHNNLEQTIKNISLGNDNFAIWLGETKESQDLTTVNITSRPANNLIFVCKDPEIAGQVTSSVLVSILTQLLPNEDITQLHLISTIKDYDNFSTLCSTQEQPHSININQTGTTSISTSINALAEEIDIRIEAQDKEKPAVFLIIHGIQYTREIHREEDLAFQFQSVVEELAGPTLVQQFQKIISRGPEYRVYSVLWCNTFNNLVKVLDSNQLKHFNNRVAFQMNNKESLSFIDSEEAANIGHQWALLYNNEQQKMTKFLPFAHPSEKWLSSIIDQTQQKTINIKKQENE